MKNTTIIFIGLFIVLTIGILKIGDIIIDEQQQEIKTLKAALKSAELDKQMYESCVAQMEIIENGSDECLESSLAECNNRLHKFHEWYKKLMLELSK